MSDKPLVEKGDEYICCGQPAKKIHETVIIPGTTIYRCEKCFQGHVTHNKEPSP